eukprot:4900477-Amphidinium_carterae.1
MCVSLPIKYLQRLLVTTYTLGSVSDLLFAGNGTKLLQAVVKLQEAAPQMEPQRDLHPNS